MLLLKVWSLELFLKVNVSISSNVYPEKSVNNELAIVISVKYPYISRVRSNVMLLVSKAVNPLFFNVSTWRKVRDASDGS